MVLMINLVEEVVAGLRRLTMLLTMSLKAAATAAMVEVPAASRYFLVFISLSSSLFAELDLRSDHTLVISQEYGRFGCIGACFEGYDLPLRQYN